MAHTQPYRGSGSLGTASSTAISGSGRNSRSVTVAWSQWRPSRRSTGTKWGGTSAGLSTNGVTQEEISEIILHLTFYAGWPAAVKAGGLAARVFEERGLPLGGGG